MAALPAFIDLNRVTGLADMSSQYDPQFVGVDPSILGRLPSFNQQYTPPVQPLPISPQPNMPPDPTQPPIGPANPTIRPIGPSGGIPYVPDNGDGYYRGGGTLASLTAPEPWVAPSPPNSYITGWNMPEMGNTFNSRFFFNEQGPYNYNEPMVPIQQNTTPWYEITPGSTVIDNSPRYNDQSWRPLELNTYQGTPYVPPYDPGPQNTFNTRFNEVYNQPFYQPQDVGNDTFASRFGDFPSGGGPSYDQWTYQGGGDFAPGDDTVSIYSGRDTLPTTIAQPLPALPGHNATGWYDPYTNATSYSQHIGPGGTPVVAGPSYVPYGGGSSFSPISSQSGIYVTPSNMPILGLPVY